MSKIFNTLVGLTVVSGAVLGLIAFLEKLNQKEKSYNLSNFDELVKHQKTVDEMNVQEILNWVNDVKKNTNDETIYIIAYPTKENIQKYQLTGFPDTMDTKHNLLFLALKKRDYTPIKLQLISFGSCDENVEKLFNGDDYTILEE